MVGDLRSIQIVRLCNCKVNVIKRFKCYKWALQKSTIHLKFGVDILLYVVKVYLAFCNAD